MEQAVLEPAAAAAEDPLELPSHNSKDNPLSSSRTQRSGARSRHLCLLSALTLLLFGCPTLCGATSGSSEPISQATADDARIPFLQTKPPSQWTAQQLQLQSDASKSKASASEHQKKEQAAEATSGAVPALDRLEPSKFQWQPQPKQAAASTTTTTTTTDRRTSSSRQQRMNVRRRHHKSARAKHNIILNNRALKHNNRNPELSAAALHNADGHHPHDHTHAPGDSTSSHNHHQHHHHQHMHTISPQVLEAHHMITTASDTLAGAEDGGGGTDDYYPAAKKGAKKAGGKQADAMAMMAMGYNETDGSGHAKAGKQKQHHHHKHHHHEHHHKGGAGGHKATAGKTSKGKKAQQHHHHSLTNEEIDAQYLHVHHMTNEEIDEHYLHVHKAPGGGKTSKGGKTSGITTTTTSSKGSKSGKIVKKGGKKGGKKGHRGGKSSKRGAGGGVRYFETSVLLEMRDHYVAPLSYLDVQQLENSVLETYNHLSIQNCDLQGRQLIAVTADPTPTSTGYILHLQGECYNCDPTSVRVFAHPDEIFGDTVLMPLEPMMPGGGFGGAGDDMMMIPTMFPMGDEMEPDDGDGGGGDMDGGDLPADGGDEGTGGAGEDPTVTDPGDALDMGGGGGGDLPTGNATTDAGDGGASMMDVPAADNGTAAADTATMMTMMEPPAAAEEPVAAAEGDPEGRNRGFGSSTSITQTSVSNIKPKKVRTASKHRSRLQRSGDPGGDYMYEQEEEADDPEAYNGGFSFGTTAQSRARYHHNEGVRKLNHDGHHHHHHHHHNHHHAVNRNPEAAADVEHHQHGANVNRDPMPMVPEEETDNRADYYSGSSLSSGMIYPAGKKGKIGGIKGYKDKESKGKKSKGSRSGGGGGSSKKGGGGGYHPMVNCHNDDAPRRAPTEEEFVATLNHVTDNLLAQYNKLSVRSAVQVRPLSCNAAEEAFGSGFVVKFTNDGSPEAPSAAHGLSPEEIVLMEQTILQSYNHLQATHSCDVPYFRQMTQLVLKGIAPTPEMGTSLAMFEAHGTCRGDGCSDGATFFDPLDDDMMSNDGDDGFGERIRRLMHGMQNVEFGPVYSASGHAIGYDGGDAHVYQEQCFCPIKVEEFGPPFVSDLQSVLNDVLEDAYEAGLSQIMATIVEIMEVPDDMKAGGQPDDDAVAFQGTQMPGATEQFESFVIVQFFGSRDLVTEQEVNAIEDSMPVIYKNLQEKDYCDMQSRVLMSSVLQTVDPGPTADSFLLGFFWVGTCDGDGCSDNPMFFAPSGAGLVPCDDVRFEGPPLIDDFENNLFSAILNLRDGGTVVNIQASGDAVEVLPGATPAPILAPAPTPTPMTFERSQMIKARNAKPSPSVAKPTKAPTYYPTWLDTDFPTYRRANT